MPGLSTITLIFGLIEYAYKAYCFIQGRIDEAKFNLAHEKLSDLVSRIHSAKNPKELQDAAKDLARAHRDILNS